MATKKRATEDAQFYKEILIKVTDWQGRVEYYSARVGYAHRDLYIPPGYAGCVKVLADYSSKKR